MDARQSLPRRWLVTDERQGTQLLPAIARLPDDGGILFRHYRLPPAGRRALFGQVRRAAGGRMILLAGDSALAAAWGADGWHGWGEGGGLHSASVHDADEIERAREQGAALLFLGPVHATRSHPGATTLGREEFRRLAALAKVPVIALGGMTEANAVELETAGAHGWAAIDHWLA